METLPRSFGRYQLVELLAIGGMAEIYRATLASAPGTVKELVIKRVLPHLAQNRDFIEMFVDEARITLPLTHGNIVQVFEFGKEGDDYFLAMEFVRGRNLETVLTRLKERGQAFPLPAALFVASEIAKGLDYAHRFRDVQDRPTGIIHRDVSPQNVLVGFQGEVKITDFGIAKARSRIRQTAQGIIRGKACYLSPEQAECRDLDGRSDLFSLGVVLDEMLTGLRPFEGDTEVATLQKVRDAVIRPPRELRPEIPAEVDAAIRRCLSRDPRERFESAGAFHAVLSRALMTLAPEYTSAALAEWMRDLFSGDITREVATRTTRDRLIAQLAKERGLDPSRLSTAELIQLGTVPIQGPTPSPPPRRRTWLVWANLAVILGIVGVLLLLWWLRDGTGGTDEGDAGGIAPVADAEAGGLAGADAGPADAGGVPDSGGLPDDAPPPADKAVAMADTGPEIRYGFLNLNAEPWALVDLDGKRLPRETPLFSVRAAEGSHRLRFFNPELRIEKVVPVTVVAGQTQTVSVRLTQP
jgi:serine/threonine-protein kinase